MQSAQSDGVCLLYPNNLGAQANVSHEMALSTLLRALQLSQQQPFTWGYIDRPSGRHPLEREETEKHAYMTSCDQMASSTSYSFHHKCPFPLMEFATKSKSKDMFYL